MTMQQTQKTTILVGASAASIACANKLRDLCPDMRLICITAENALPYNRCLLADYLGGSKNAEQITIRTADFFTDKNIEFYPNTRVTSLNLEEKTVTTNQNKTIAYDNLFLGIGKSAYIPEPSWLTISGVLPFYDQEHATALRTYIADHAPQKAIVIGAGLTGLEAADALTQHGIEVTILERAEQILPRQIDPTGAEFLTNLMHAQAQVTVVTNALIAEIRSTTPRTITITLTNNASYTTNLVVLATGGKSNSFLADKAGIACNNFGIITNENMRTSDPHVFAGGDACSIKNILTNEQVTNSLWADAVMQGNVAAHSIAGIEKTYPGALLITSSTIFGTTFVTSGDITNADTYESRYKKDATSYHRILLQENILKGFVMVGNIIGIGQLRRALMEQKPIQL
jgi:NAD(P)H-nitrite reductase large subunit